MAPTEPYICEPTDPSSGRPATFIFLHGYSDDAQGLPMGKCRSLTRLWRRELRADV